jgi:hypothetical protein
MSPDAGADGVSALSPDDAFALLGNETRVDILRALWEAYEPYAEGNAVPFSALYDRVDVEDTGNFNYHLGKLTGHFVRRTGAGYELTESGFSIVQAVVAGTATENPVLEPTVVDATCPRCESEIAVVHEDGTTWARCTECEGYWPGRNGEVFGFSLPPRGLKGRDPAGVLRATMVYSLHRFASMSDGVCPECGGVVESTLEVCEEHDPEGGVCDACDSHFLGVTVAVCNACTFAWRSPSWAPLHEHPALVAFYYEHGVEHTPTTWAGMRRSFDWCERLRSIDPPSVRVTVPCDGDELQFVLDEEGRVAAVRAPQ